MKKIVVSSLIICSLMVTNFIFVGCGTKKQEKSTTEKIVDYVGSEIKAKFTGRVDEIAGWYLKYDHAGLEKAVINPRTSESKATAKKVLGQIKYLNERWAATKMSVKEIMEVIESIDEKTAIALKLKMDYDIKNGNDVSKNFIPLNHRKWFAMNLSSELETAVSIVCNDILGEKSQDIIAADWNSLLDCRERVTNYIDNKPVIYKTSKNENINESHIDKNLN